MDNSRDTENSFVRKSYQWKSLHTERMLALLATVPLAATNVNMEQQLLQAFRMAKVDAEKAGEKPHQLCPMLEHAIAFYQGVEIAFTHKELFLFGKNGALAIMRNDNFFGDNLYPVALGYTKDQLLKVFAYYYERAGQDHCDVWGEPFIAQTDKAA